MIIDIKDFYSPRSKKILDDSINFAAVRTNKKKKINTIQHARKIPFYNNKIPCQKKNTNLLDLAIKNKSLR